METTLTREALEKAREALSDSHDDVVNSLNSYIDHPANARKRKIIAEQLARHQDAIAAIDRALATAVQPQPVECKTCGGTRIITTGWMTHSEGGAPFDEPIRCTDDCPDCASPAPILVGEASERRAPTSDDFNRLVEAFNGRRMHIPDSPAEFIRSAANTIAEDGCVIDQLMKLKDHYKALASPPPAQTKAPTMDDAIAAGDGTLHGAITYWQKRALAAEAARDVDETNKVLADNYLKITAPAPGQPQHVEGRKDGESCLEAYLQWPTHEASDCKGVVARLRHIAKLAGVDGALPDDDATVYGALLTCLGMVRAALERANQATVNSVGLSLANLANPRDPLDHRIGLPGAAEGDKQ